MVGAVIKMTISLCGRAVTSESSSGWAADQRGKYLGVNNGDDRAGRR